MRYLIGSAFLLLALASGCATGGSSPSGSPAGSLSGSSAGSSGGPAADPVVLFDGSSLAGWSHAGPGDFQLVDGALQSRGGMGLLWYSERSFDDFVLDLDWRVTASTDNSGVFIRFPDPGDDPGVAVRTGYEIQINDNPAGDPQKTGAVYGVQPASSRASRPVGDWNHYRIQAIGNEYTVWLNGVLVNRLSSTDPNRGRAGYLGLQNHDAGSAVQYRDVLVRQLPR